MDKEIQTAWNTLYHAGIITYWDAVDLAIKWYDRHPKGNDLDVERLFGASVEENAAFEMMEDERHKEGSL